MLRHFEQQLTMLVDCSEETELATKSEQDMKQLQHAISQLQLELRDQSRQPKVSPDYD